MKFLKGLSDTNLVIVTTKGRTDSHERDIIQCELEEKLEKKVVVLPNDVYIIGIDIAKDYKED